MSFQLANPREGQLPLVIVGAMSRRGTGFLLAANVKAKVVGLVVAVLSVAMVHQFVSVQRSTKNLRHHQAVFVNMLGIAGGRSAVKQPKICGRNGRPVENDVAPQKGSAFTNDHAGVAARSTDAAKRSRRDVSLDRAGLLVSAAVTLWADDGDVSQAMLATVRQVARVLPVDLRMNDDTRRLKAYANPRVELAPSREHASPDPVENRRSASEPLIAAHGACDFHFAPLAESQGGPVDSGVSGRVKVDQSAPLVVGANICRNRFSRAWHGIALVCAQTPVFTRARSILRLPVQGGQLA